MGKRPYPITEGIVRNAIANSKDNTAAADYLNVSLPTWKKYATRYIDPETGLSLYELHSANYKKKTNFKAYWWNNMDPERKAKWGFQPTPIEDILSNKKSFKDTKRLMKRLVNDNVRPLKCEICGYDNRAVYPGERDKSSAYYWANWNLHRLDLSENNNRLDNLLIVCKCCENNIFRNKKAYKEMITENGKVLPSSEIIKKIMALTGVALTIANNDKFEVSEKLRPVLEGPTQAEAIANISKKNKNYLEDIDDELDLNWED